MCDPLTLSGIALTGASTVASAIGASQVASARNDALAAERIRQGQLDQEAAAINARSQDRYQGFDDQQAERSTKLGDYFAGQQATAQAANRQAASAQQTPPSSSTIVVQEEARQRAGARQAAEQQGRALGNLRSFGDLLGGVSREQARDASLVGQLGGFKQGSSKVLASELEAANAAGDGLRMFGDVLGLGGTLLTGKGLQGSLVGAGRSPMTIAPSIASGGAGRAAAGSTAELFRLY
jgi:hypothetical protein